MSAGLKWLCIAMTACVTGSAPVSVSGQDQPAAALSTQPAAAVVIPGPQDIHPTLITLHLHKQPLPTLLAEITRQSGVPIQLFGGMDGGLTVDVDQQPFWQVLDDLCKQAHVAVQGGYQQGLQIYTGNDESQSRQVISGPVMAKFNQIEHLAQMTAAPGQQDFCDVQISVMWEPRLDVAYYEVTSLPTVAVDENGLSLVPENQPVDPRNSYETKFQYFQRNGGNSYQFSHSIRLKVPVTAGRRITHLAGQIRIWVSDKSQNAIVSDLTTAMKSRKQQATIGDTGKQLTITNIWMSGGQTQIQLAATKSADETDDQWNQRKCMMHSIKAHLFDARGQKWGDSLEQNWGNYGGDNFQDYLQIQRNDGIKSQPKKAVLEVPTSAKEIDIPYDLHDLPLP